MKKKYFVMIITSFIIILSFSCASKSEGLVRDDVKLLINAFLKAHVSENSFNDKISERTLDNLINSLDPMKMFFMKSDITEFAKYKTELDDDFKAENYDFLETITNRYLKRFDEKMTTVKSLLKNDYDFTIDEYLDINTDETDYPDTEAQAAERWRKYIKFQMLNYINIGKSQEEAKDKIRKRYDITEKDVKAQNDSDMYANFVNAVAMSLDPHTSYMTPEENQDFQISMQLKLSGIGATLRSEDGFIFVESIIKGGPVSRMKGNNAVKVNDKIIAVAQGDGEPVNVIDMLLRDAVKMIRGKKGTTVKLTIIRSDPETNTQQTLVIPVVRDEVVLETEATKYDSYKYDKNLNIGYIKLPSFYSAMSANDTDAKSSAADMKKAIAELKKQKINSLVLDLRGNPGGSLPEAVEIAGLFIKTGPVLMVKDSTAVRSYPDTDPSVQWDGPLVVLIDGFSASASEIFAGAMRDYNRALIIGSGPTFGKGSVQTYQDLRTKGALKVTIQIFYQPDGTSNNNVGIKPNITIPSYSQIYDYSENQLKYNLDWKPVPKAEFNSYDKKYVTPFMIAALNKASLKRMNADPKFKKLNEDIKKYKEQYNAKRISLKKDSQEDINNSRKKQDEYEKNRGNNDIDAPVINLDADLFLKEVFNVTSDYSKYFKN
ncbi:MAG: carboxy terminal-processing peptidase [Spirochaetes bacterium]|nr:carboxy terminal-processing peptidase [Spirochaetota bacterium]